jgi:ankyrin repeat protein
MSLANELELITMKKILDLFDTKMPETDLFHTLDSMFFSFNINTKDYKGLSFLHHAIMDKYYSITEYLLKKGADPNTKSNIGETPLIHASKYGYYPFVQLLIQYGANPDIYDNSNDSALLWASYNGHLEIVIFLIKYKADPYHKYKDGKDALRWAINSKHLNIVEFLIQFLDNVLYKDIYNKTIFDIDTSIEIINLLNDWINEKKILLCKYFLKHNNILIEYNILGNINKYLP